MPPVSVCGRFDNAPAHVIIVSEYFSTHPLGLGGDKELCDEEYEERKALRAAELEGIREARRLENNSAVIERTKAKAEQVARDKTERHRLSLERQSTLVPRTRKVLSQSPFLDTSRKRPSQSKKRASPITDEELVLPYGVPSHYVWLQSIKDRLTDTAIIVSIKNGKLSGVKAHRKWYVDPVQIREYSAGADERRKDRARASLAKARMARFGTDRVRDLSDEA